MFTQPIALIIDTPILTKMLAITEQVGRMEGLRLLRPQPRLREKNRASTVRGSTGIEGNNCSLAEVEAIANGKSVAASKKDILEVKNALSAYDALRTYTPYLMTSFLKAHATLMEGGLMLGAGHFRKEAVEVYITEETTRAMPPWKTVEPSMRALFDYLRTSDDPLLLKSILFHLKCVLIHPFTDGNGRTARLWQTRLLMECHPIFEFLDVESMIFEKRLEYYTCIRKAQEHDDANVFVSFMLDQVHASLQKLWDNSGPIVSGWQQRIEDACTSLNGKTFTRQDYLALQKTITPVTASRDLKAALDAKLLTSTGNKRTTCYQFRK